MNDFTKDELQKILNFIEHRKQDSYDDMRFSTIINKIQSLIDIYDAQIIPAWHCEKCGHVQ